MNNSFHSNHMSSQLQYALDDPENEGEVLELFDPVTQNTKYVIMTVATYDNLLTIPEEAE